MRIYGFSSQEMDPPSKMTLDLMVHSEHRTKAGIPHSLREPDHGCRHERPPQRLRADVAWVKRIFGQPKKYLNMGSGSRTNYRGGGGAGAGGADMQRLRFVRCRQVEIDREGTVSGPRQGTYQY